VTAELTVSTTADDVAAHEWDSLVPPGAVYLRHAWLRQVQECFGLRLVLFRLRRRGTLTAAMPALLLPESDPYPYHDPAGALFGAYELDHLRQALLLDRGEAAAGAMSALLAAVVREERTFAQSALYPALVSTSPYGFAGGILAVPGPERAAAVEALLREVDDYCTAHGVRSQSVLWQDDTDPVTETVLRRRGFQPVLADQEYHLDLGGVRDFAGYLAGLEHRRARVIGTEMRRFERSGATAERLREPTGDDIRRCAGLAMAHHEKYGLPADPDALARMFDALLRERTLGARLDVIRRDGELGGFVLSFHAGGVLYPKFLGFDAAVVGNSYAYFNLVFYHLIREAIAAGAHRIAYGMGSADAKQRRGARPAPVRSWFRMAEPSTRRRLEPYITVFDVLKRQILMPREDPPADLGERQS